MIGRTVGTYKIAEKIGEGGMGAVYKGVDLMLERTVAVKVLRPELAQQPRVLERFRSEAITLARLNHPNIATLYSFLQDGDEFFMILEFVQGQTFEEVLQRGAMPCEEALSLFGQALDGIAHAHAHGIIHRDVKPANVMLTDTGSVKVMDFGIARVLGTARMTRTGHLIGTIEYMSPEQVRGQETDARSDIYSLGILLYEMLTGRVPFEADSDFALMQAHVKQTPRPLRALRPSVPAAVEQVVLRSLAKKPGARFQDAMAFRAALDEAYQPGAASVGASYEAGKGFSWLRHLFTTPSEAASTSQKAARRTEAATPSPPAEARAKTRLVEEKATRLAPEAEAGPAVPLRLATLSRRVRWRYAAPAAPVLLAVLAFVLWKPRWFPEKTEGPVSDTLAVVDTTKVLPAEGEAVVQVLPPDPPVARDRPVLLSPEEFARLNPPPGQPLDAPERVPDTPTERTPPSRREPQRVAEEPKRVAEEPETPRLGSVRVIVRPFGDVFVDGSRKARDTNQPYSEDVPAGTYLVRAVHPTYGVWEKHISVEAGETREVLFNFNAEFQVTVTSQPSNAEIFLDGRPTGRYTPSVLTVRPGQHTLTVRKKGYASDGGSRSIVVERTLKDPIHFTLQEN